MRVDENAACGLCYTSGTTGRPKVCLLNLGIPHLGSFLLQDTVYCERCFLCCVNIVCRLKPRGPGNPLFLWPLLIGAAYVCGIKTGPNPPCATLQGVLYSHRANFLHAFTVAMPDASCMTSATSVLAVVPAFHANCWGLLFSAPLVGAKLVMPGAGPHLQQACTIPTCSDQFLQSR